MTGSIEFWAHHSTWVSTVGAVLLTLIIVNGVDDFLKTVSNPTLRMQLAQSCAVARPIQQQMPFGSAPQLIRTIAQLHCACNIQFDARLPSQLSQQLDELLVAAGNPYGLTRSEWCFLILIACAFGTLLFLALPDVLSVLGLFAPLFPAAYLLRTKRVRTQLLIAPLPSWALSMSLLLRSGMNTERALEISQNAVSGPLQSELAHLNQSIQFGEAPSEAMQVLSDRIKIEDLSNLVTAIHSTVHYGGSLAPAFEELGKQLLSSAHAREEKRALETPVRILPALLTIFVLIFFLLFAPVYSIWSGGLA